ncbi:hypothetical protein GCM10027592_01830 [Spirosoma flavus]
MFLIILIDDDPLLLGIIERAASLSFPEAYFKQLNSLEQAKEYFDNPENLLPKLILLDIGLPDNETGIGLLNSLRDNKITYITPIIMLTNNDSSIIIQESYNSGASSYILKPDSLVKWKEQLSILRAYWLQTVTLPPKD